MYHSGAAGSIGTARWLLISRWPIFRGKRGLWSNGDGTDHGLGPVVARTDALLGALPQAGHFIPKALPQRIHFQMLETVAVLTEFKHRGDAKIFFSKNLRKIAKNC